MTSLARGVSNLKRARREGHGSFRDLALGERLTLTLRRVQGDVDGAPVV
jgi:hypothetical protein